MPNSRYTIATWSCLLLLTSQPSVQEGFKEQSGSQATKKGATNKASSKKKPGMRPWIIRQQEKDGHFSSANGKHDLGVTALAVLALVGDGSTSRNGAYRKEVLRAIAWIRKQAGEDWSFSVQKHRTDWDMVLALLALVEDAGMSKLPKQLAIYQGAVSKFLGRKEFLKRFYCESHDKSVDAQLMRGWLALLAKSCKDFKIKRPENFDKSMKRWLERGEDPQRASAIAALSRLLSQIHVNQAETDMPRLEALAARILEQAPRWKKGAVDMQFMFLATVGVYQVGKEAWKRWREALEPCLLESQRKKMPEHGSWDPIGRRGSELGRVYSSALAVLCLEIYYCYSTLIR